MPRLNSERSHSEQRCEGRRVYMVVARTRTADELALRLGLVIQLLAQIRKLVASDLVELGTLSCWEGKGWPQQIVFHFAVTQHCSRCGQVAGASPARLQRRF